MPTLGTANTYFQAAQTREQIDDPTEAKKFYIRAANEYAVLRKEYHHDPSTLNFIDGRIAQCLESVNQYTISKENARINVGDNEYRAKKRFESKKPDINFEHVAGMNSLKKKLEQFITWPLKYPDRYSTYVKKKTFGVLLYGPPGCGKTHIVKAAVGEANKAGNNISFIYIGPDDILDSWVGNSEKNMAAAFRSAAEAAPCVLFFDEIDGLGRSRSGRSIYADRLVNQFLMSFETLRDKNVVVVGATNFPWIVDPALIRSGRLGTRIYVAPPDLEARAELFMLSNKGLPVNGVDYRHLAALTENYTCSDIDQICVDAGLYTLANGGLTDKNRKMELEDFKAAIESNKPSLYNWCNEAAKQLRKQTIAKEFSDLVTIVNKVAPNTTTKHYDAPEDDGSEDG